MHIPSSAAWNWMYYPVDWVMAAVIDNVVGALAVGLVLAAMVKPEKQTALDQ